MNVRNNLTNALTSTPRNTISDPFNKQDVSVVDCAAENN